MIKKIILHLFNTLAYVLPFTSLFRFRSIFAKEAGINIGKHVRICGRTCFLGSGDVLIGDNTWIGLNNSFYRTDLASITLGKDCDVGPDVKFVTGSHKLGSSNRRAGVGTGGNIEIGDGCWIGACVTILGGVTIGAGSMVAAGSLVISDMPENCLIAGVPAVVKREFPIENL